MVNFPFEVEDESMKILSFWKFGGGSLLLFTSITGGLWWLDIHEESRTRIPPRLGVLGLFKGQYRNNGGTESHFF